MDIVSVMTDTKVSLKPRTVADDLQYLILAEIAKDGKAINEDMVNG